MVKAVVTQVGTENRYVTGKYHSKEELMENHQVPWHWEGTKAKFEIYEGEVRGEPIDVIVVDVKP